MKSLLLILSVFVIGAVNTSFISEPNEKDLKITVKYSFKGIVDGYDHPTKTELYIDDELKGTSTVSKESQPNSVTATATKGKHRIRIVNYAQYEGNWEEHTIANNYSIDCLYEAEVSVKKNLTIKLLFDLDSGTKKVK